MTITTARLTLRPFREEDRDAFAAINGDPRVSDWLGGPIDRAASDTILDRIDAEIAEHGFSFWAAELTAEQRLIGAIGIRRISDELPCAPAIEAGWRLAPDVWGQGLASEGARAAIDWGFAHLPEDEIIAITAIGNLRSQAVMRRIGMFEQPDRAFDHPLLPDDHPLRRHVLYAARRQSLIPLVPAGPST